MTRSDAPDGRLHLHDVLPGEEFEGVVPLESRDTRRLDLSPRPLQGAGGLLDSGRDLWVDRAEARVNQPADPDGAVR